MKLIQRVNIAHSFVQSVHNLFHFIVLSLPMRLSKNFSKPSSKSVSIAAENMSCVNIKQQKLGVNENSACSFHIGWNE